LGLADLWESERARSVLRAAKNASLSLLLSVNNNKWFRALETPDRKGSGALFIHPWFFEKLLLGATPLCCLA
jgi:hypothetical protein